ncbi:methyl-accepting chemotaxis protein [Roseibium sp. SCPC15]|uniref:methyl-accepting chemotaxis protein n=1 Tax=Roseibium sp. SCP15 TaxID=3141376 RepID=UPI003337B3B7
MDKVKVLDRTPLKLRVVVLALGAVAGLSFVGIANLVSDKMIEAATAKYQTINETYADLAGFQRQMLALRVAEQTMRADREADTLPPLDKRLSMTETSFSDADVAPPVALAFDHYLKAIEGYRSALKEIGYRDRLSVEVGEEGQAGIDSPTGHLVDVSNAITRTSSRISEELEFDDQPAVFQAALAFEAARRDIQKLLSLSDTSYLPAINSGLSQLTGLLEDPDLDPDFAEALTGLLQDLNGGIGTLAGSETTLTGFEDAVNASYTQLDTALTTQLQATTEQADIVRTELASTKSLISGLILAAILVTFLVLAIASFVITRSISRNLGAITSATNDLARGEIDHEIPLTDVKTEVGELARALLIFQDNARARRQLETEIETENTVKAERQEHIEQTIAAFRQDIVGLLDTADGTITRARGTAEKLQDVNSRNTEQAVSADDASRLSSENVQTVASATQQLSSSINEISEQVNMTSDQISLVNESARTTNEDVDQLAKASAKIDEIIALIQAIAEQTNLLALNATIEAARAGEHGRGFSVVASEVKSLANQTATATEEISAQIKAIQSSSRATVDAMANISRIITDVQTSTSMIAGAVEEQTAATNEISHNINEAANRTQQMAENVSELLSTASEARRSAEDIHEASDEINDINARMNQRIDDFLQEVSAA